MMSLPLEPMGLVAASLYIVVSAVLMGRPVLARYLPFVHPRRYKTRVPLGFLLVGAGMMLTILNVRVVGFVDAVDVTKFGYLLMGAGALIGGWICWSVVPDIRPDLMFEDEDDEPPGCDE